MAVALKVLTLIVLLAAVTVAAAETHHVGGWGPDFNVSAWLLGRRFTVGDKLRFEYDDEKIVELGCADEFMTCNLTNPIRMLTDPLSHVTLEEEGVRYFTSGDPQTCRNGLKLPVTVTRAHDFDPSPPYKVPPPPPYEPYKPPPSTAAARLNGGLCLLFAAASWIYNLDAF